MRERLAALNPAASARVASRLLEAHDRRYWDTDDAMLAIAAVAIIVSGTRQRGALALELVIGGRMGIRPRAVAASLIGASLATAAVATAAGLAGARLLVGWLVPRIDPGPEFAPRFAGQLSTSSIVGGISVVIGASLFGVLLQFRGATSTPTSEVLRGAD